MAESAVKILEGVFAVKKPPSISSAQVIRDLQHAFSKSRTFAPLLDQTLATEAQNRQRSKRRRRNEGDSVFKIGHGGTLDPMATGVLIIGIGRGTKSLQSFLDCTKTYETVVLFGKSTDTYDVAGKVVATKETTHIDRTFAESKLATFRGKIKQAPPIYSAIRINGMKAYEYARSGKELPRELAVRDMTVSECELLEWYEPGQHDYRWPSAEAPQEEKDAFRKLVDNTNIAEETQPVAEKQNKNVPVPKTRSSPKASEPPVIDAEAVRARKALLHTHHVTGLSVEPANAPAARVKLTVSSGFYVRSFAHDLGIACGSYGTMTELARTRQGRFTVNDVESGDFIPALDHAHLDKGEDVWAPQLVPILENWLAKNPLSPHGLPRNQGGHYRSIGRRYDQENARKRRNSSSPE